MFIFFIYVYSVSSLKKKQVKNPFSQNAIKRYSLTF